ncbi:tetratricopeptide repeat protein [Tundrisphaera sp. TA3]|uniref:tetratricopeptide repeat protein n=1 Tax=Tundrisphaera sp. TA3 TaxID=3435775 RepID=UPI003EB81297
MRESALRALSLLAPLALVSAGCHQAAKKPAEHASAQLLGTPSDKAKVSHRQAADVQVALGRSLEEQGQAAGAEDAYRRALENDPRRADAHARLAVLLDLKGDFPGGAKHFAEAARLEPKNPEWRCDLGYHFAIQRRWAEAEKGLREAIDLDRNHARAHNNLGMVLAHRGDDEAALAEFARAGLDPSDARANLGLILASEGQLSEAERAYAGAMAEKPTSIAARDGHHAVVAARTAPRAGAVAARPRVDDAIRRASADLPPLP